MLEVDGAKNERMPAESRPASDLESADFSRGAAFGSLSPVQGRMLLDIYKLSAVSAYIDAQKCDPWRLVGAELDGYLRSSARRLDVLSGAFAEIGYRRDLHPFDYLGFRASNAIFHSGKPSDRQIWFVAHHDHRAALGA
jgi:hypothetical protein